MSRDEPTATPLDLGDDEILTVRALHHFDQIGLLRSAGRSAAGHRLYDEDSVWRLYRILALRDLGMALYGIARVLDNAADDLAQTIGRQLRQADERIAQYRHLRRRSLALHDAKKQTSQPSIDKDADALAAVAVLRQLADLLEAAAAPVVSENLFRREGEYWTIRFAGSVALLKDAKGLRLLARLLADPGREFHAVDLEAAASQAQRLAPPAARAGTASELPARPDLGDAGELLDARAKAAYKARLGELAAELEEAERCNDPGRAATAAAERGFLVRELARAVGLGGRDRRAASHAERARLNVTRAIRAAMASLARANPPLGRHLAATIRTGRYCSYTPDPRAPITWEL